MERLDRTRRHLSGIAFRRGGSAVAIALVALCCGLTAPGAASAAPPSLSGAVAYTEVLRFDYDQDGEQSQVQFWLEFKGRPTAAGPGDADLPAGGEIRYYLVDLDKKINIPKWHAGFPMMAEPPPSGPYPMRGLVIDGAAARFEAFGRKWTVVDGGEGFAQDWVTVDDGFKPKVMRLYGGDLRVESAETWRSLQDRRCATCHGEAAAGMSLSGGPHAAVSCTECHAGHPPAVDDPTVACTQCHDAHDDAMKEGSCAKCHRAHAATVVRYDFDISAHYCGACHQQAVATLRAGGGKHSHLGCALCHPATHTATADCRHCHGAPHPSHVMANVGICGSCHGTAHKVDSPRASR